MLSARPSDALANNAVQVSVEGASATDFIGKRTDKSNHPLAFLVEGPPHYVIPAHFHDIDQYQIFVGGHATLGKHDVLPGSIHYADAFTPYGPIAAGEEGFAYLTLRPVSSSGYVEMPGGGALVKAQNTARGRRGRMMVADVESRQRDETAIRSLFEQEDGVAAFQMSAAPNATLPQPDVAHGGAYFVVLDGEIAIGDATYPSRSCIWIGADEPVPLMIAGGRGARAAFVSFATG